MEVNIKVQRSVNYSVEVNINSLLVKFIFTCISNLISVHEMQVFLHMGSGITLVQ